MEAPPYPLSMHRDGICSIRLTWSGRPNHSSKHDVHTSCYRTNILLYIIRSPPSKSQQTEKEQRCAWPRSRSSNIQQPPGSTRYPDGMACVRPRVINFTEWPASPNSALRWRKSAPRERRDFLPALVRVHGKIAALRRANSCGLLPRTATCEQHGTKLHEFGTHPGRLRSSASLMNESPPCDRTGLTEAR